MKVYSEQAKQKQRHNEHSKACNFKPGDTGSETFMVVLKWILGVKMQMISAQNNTDSFTVVSSS